MPNITLSDAIQNLRGELTIAMQRASEDKDALHFQLGPIEMELEVAATRVAEGKAGIKWWLVEAGVGGKLESSSKHKIKLVLAPLGNGGAPVVVSAPDPRPR